MGVQVAIVLARAERAVFLCNKEKRGGLWGLGRNDSSSLKVFINEGFACFLFLRINGIYLSDLGNKLWLKIDGVVIWSMGGKKVMSFLQEYIIKVQAPVQNLLIRDFGSLGQFSGQGDLIEVFTIKICLREVLT